MNNEITADTTLETITDGWGRPGIVVPEYEYEISRGRCEAREVLRPIPTGRPGAGELTPWRNRHGVPCRRTSTHESAVVGRLPDEEHGWKWVRSREARA